MNRKRIALFALAPLAALLLLACTGNTEVIRDTGRNAVEVQGEGRVRAAPDLVIFNTGVSVVRDSIADARAEAADAMAEVVASLRGNGVAEEDLTTTYISVYPEYDYSEGAPALTGFRVDNRVSARIKDIVRADAIIDAAIAAGGDRIVVDGITFSIEDIDALEDEARERAVEDAGRRAAELARLTGVDLGAIVAVSEVTSPGAFGVGGYDRAVDESAAASGGPTPVLPGQVVVTSTVVVTYAID